MAGCGGRRAHLSTPSLHPVFFFKHLLQNLLTLLPISPSLSHTPAIDHIIFIFSTATN
ncbi:hypothetical protein [Fervidibacter sacchari]